MEKHGIEPDNSQLRGLGIALDMHCRLDSNTRTPLLWHLDHHEVTPNTKCVNTVWVLIPSILHIELNLLKPPEPAPVSDESRLDHLSQIS